MQLLPGGAPGHLHRSGCCLFEEKNTEVSADPRVGDASAGASKGGSAWPVGSAAVLPRSARLSSHRPGRPTLMPATGLPPERCPPDSGVENTTPRSWKHLTFLQSPGTSAEPFTLFYSEGEVSEGGDSVCVACGLITVPLNSLRLTLRGA